MKDSDDTPPNPFLSVLEPPPLARGRCGAHARTTGQPCRKWALIGRTRCRLHGGAQLSGRPPTSGRYTAQKVREKRFVRLVSQILAAYYEKPDPIEAPPETYDSCAVTALAREATLMTATSGDKELLESTRGDAARTANPAPSTGRLSPIADRADWRPLLKTFQLGGGTKPDRH